MPRDWQMLDKHSVIIAEVFAQFRYNFQHISLRGAERHPQLVYR
jgi:hypothetical protein